MADIEPVTFAQHALEVSKALLPPYRSKYSKRIYTQPQLLAILCLIRYRDWAVRKAVRKLSEQEEFLDALELSRMPHSSTLYRFRRLIDIQDLSTAFEETLRMLSGAPKAKAVPKAGVEDKSFKMDDKQPIIKKENSSDYKKSVLPGSTGAYEGALQIAGTPIGTAAFPDEIIRAPSRMRRVASSSWFYPVFYLLMIAFSESIIAFFNPQVGLFIHGILLVALFLQASLVNQKKGQNLFIAIAFAPLLRILSLSLPLGLFLDIFQYLVIGVPLTIAAVYAVRMMRLSRRSLGVTARSLPLQLLVGLSGIGIGCFQYLILEPAPLVESLQWQEIWLPALILLLFTGLLEEFIFRGLMQSSATQVLGLSGGILIAALYAVMHIGHRSALEIFFIFDIALYFGLVVQRTGSLLGVALAHGLTNITLYLIFPFYLAAPEASNQSLLYIIGSKIEAGLPVYSTAVKQMLYLVTMMLKL